MSLTVYNWFEQILGFNEKDFHYTINEIPKDIIPKMGEFEILSLGELKEEFKKNKKNRNTNLLLHIKYRDGYTNINQFDTSALQFNCSHSNALFQVASNFNCLEIPRADYNPFNGYYITNKMSDNTQGPSAAGGCAFGSILRLIQHKEKPINLLEDTPLIVNNGKVKYSENKHFKEFDSDLIKIGLHKNVRACFLRSNEFKYNKDGPVINQIYTSTCINSNNNVNDLSVKLLQAAYEATYLAAIITQAPEIVLTLIGGGVFNNSHQSIIDILVMIHNKYSPYLSKNCNVILPLFEPKPVHILQYCYNMPNIKIEKII